MQPQRPRAIARARRFDDPIDVARPFVWIAFATGFWGYLAALPLLSR
jgi:hypothetical protein